LKAFRELLTESSKHTEEWIGLGITRHNSKKHVFFTEHAGRAAFTFKGKGGQLRHLSPSEGTAWLRFNKVYRYIPKSKATEPLHGPGDLRDMPLRYNAPPDAS